jgi:hypothetical protein
MLGKPPRDLDPVRLFFVQPSSLHRIAPFHHGRTGPLQKSFGASSWVARWRCMISLSIIHSCAMGRVALKEFASAPFRMLATWWRREKRSPGRPSSGSPDTFAS